MAAKVVANAFLSATIHKLFERLTSPELLNNTAASKLKQLEQKLMTARLYLDDAENRQLRDKSIKEWLDNLKHVVFQADDLSEDIHDTKNRSSGRKFLMEFLKSFLQCLAGTTFRGELDEILLALDVLLDRAIVLGLKHCDGTAHDGDGGYSSTPNAAAAPLLAQHHVFGRNVDKAEILELLLSDKAFGTRQNVGTETGELSQKKIGVVPIVGMGGIGKTTLAHLVYHDTTRLTARLTEAEFILKAWVTVSTDFDVVKILKSILQQINPGAAKNETGELSQLQEKMKDALSSKKFLIVLDDVWDEDYSMWNLLKSNFEWGALGSRVVVTTRSEEVAKMVTTGPIHKLREVSSEECWSIFIDHAFSGGDSSSYPRLHKIGRDIVEKCGGLPLAVMAMGGLLCSKRDPREWVNILNSPIWECGKNQGNKVLPSLWLSYRYLPSSLKQCFAYCSVFPQDYEFDKEQIVLLWMAEGFLPCDEKGKQSMEETGEKYFDDLVSRSLFQRSGRDESEFVMHDLVHDMAVFVSGELCVSVAAGDADLKRVTIQTRHLSHHDNFELDSKLWTGLSEAKHLRTFLRRQGHRRSGLVFCRGEFRDGEFVKLLMRNHRRLRALSIGHRDPISDSFGNLKQLRYLNLSNCSFEEVPSSVCTLFYLQTLILSYCEVLTQLPTDMTKLIKLRHLDISGSHSIKHMPPHMGNLKELRTLSDFIVGDPDIVSACSNIKEMQELQHLSGTLRISGLENAAKFQDVGKDILRHKPNLKKLVLRWDDTSISRREDKDILDGLQPHSNMEKLVIEGYLASSFPTWVREMPYEKLVSVKLDGRFCESLPPFWQLPSLSKLVIRGFEKLEKIGLEFYGNDSSTSRFQCLETLELHQMESLKEWVIVDNAFPCLKKLKLVGCKDLPGSLIDCNTVEELEIWGNSCLESFPLDKFPMLRELSLRECGNLKALTNDGNSESVTSSLTHLRIFSCSKLMAPETRLDLQNLAALESLEISHCKCESAAAAASMSSELFAQELLPSSLASLQLHHLRGFKSINGSAFQQAKSLETLEIWYCPSLESLPEEELLSSLSTLKIYHCPLLERKYNKSKGDESYQRISHIPNITIFGLTT